MNFVQATEQVLALCPANKHTDSSSNGGVDDHESNVGILIPPLLFGLVDKGVYRSGYPNPRNFSFIRSLRLKSILYLSPKPYKDVNMKFIRQNDIQLFHMGVEGNQEPFICTDQKVFREALSCLLDVRNHPILVHCDKGKHRTGCLVGCYRKLQKRAMTSIFDEYSRHAGEHFRLADQQFIELFQYEV